MDKTHPVLGVGLVGMPAVCTVGPRVNADNGRSDVPQEPKSLQAFAKVYYVLGE